MDRHHGHKESDPSCRLQRAGLSLVDAPADDLVTDVPAARPDRPSTSNPTRRVTAILDLLTTYENGFTLTEIARRLELSKSTCLAILTELTASSYLSHDKSTRHYRLGPALLASSETLSKLLPGIPAIRTALADLSEELGLVCGANLLAGDELVAILRFGPTVSLDAPVGQRIPFAAPFGFAFVAWSDRSTFRDWVNRSPSSVGPAALAALEHSLAIARQRGFAVLRDDPSVGLRRLALELQYLRKRHGFEDDFSASATALLEAGVHLDEILPRNKYQFMSIHAPVRRVGARAIIAPHILGTSLELPGSTILRYGRRLAEVCASLVSPPSL
jgi:DNA-binding IclR family transcriptional regulator